MRPRDAARATENARVHCGLYVRGVTKATRSFICLMGWAHREIHHTWPAAIDGYRRQTSRRENAAPTRRRVFGATNRPDGQISDRNENLSSPISKNISLSPSGKSVLPARAISSPKRGVGHRHERGMGCGGRGSAGAQGDRRASLTACERFTARRTNGACCVRQNRVVLASVADVKPAEMRRPNRAWTSLHPLATVTKRIRRRGEHSISRKTIAQGMPDCLR